MLGEVFLKGGILSPDIGVGVGAYSGEVIVISSMVGMP